MKKAILALMLVIAAIQAQAQQDTQVSQYIFNGLYYNPAYAGYKEDLYIQSYFRSQWVGITGAPKSFAVSADGACKDGSVGLGMMLTNDQIGAQSVMTGYLSYAYRIQMGDDEDSHLAFGIAGGMMQLGIDGSKLYAVQAGDQAIPVASQTRIIPDANFGIFYSREKYFMGISATNLLARYMPDNSGTNVLVPIPQPHFYLTGGLLIPMNDDAVFKPVFLLKDDIKGPTTVDLDAIFLLNERVSFGGFYRSSVKIYQKNNLQNNLPDQNAFGAMAEFFVTPSIRIGYSYDQALNSLATYSYGSHELSVGFYLDSRQSKHGNVNGNYGESRCYKF